MKVDLVVVTEKLLVPRSVVPTGWRFVIKQEGLSIVDQVVDSTVFTTDLSAGAYVAEAFRVDANGLIIGDIKAGEFEVPSDMVSVDVAGELQVVLGA